MKASEFVQSLVDEMQQVFADLGDRETLESESEGRVEVITLLRVALASELEASELAGLWLPSTPELDAKRLLAQQCGEEMRHFELISERLRELGADPEGQDPLGEGYSPLYEYLRGLSTTVERVAAGPFAREAIAEVRNAQFIHFCRSIGDEETARLYDEIIQPEEIHHHRLGREYLERHATSAEQQEAAAAAVRNTLAIADELRTLAARTTGGGPIPVS